PPRGRCSRCALLRARARAPDPAGARSGLPARDRRLAPAGDAVTYLAFHAVFILPPIFLLLWRRRGRTPVHPRETLFLVAIAAIAFVYTTPWDNHLVWRGVWS